MTAILTVLKLRKGDTVRDSAGRIGKVTGFGRDHVHVEWPDGVSYGYTDADLKAHGVVKVGR